MARCGRIRVKYRKLGREKAWGQTAHPFVEVDERTRGIKRLEIILHESIHILAPEWSEERVACAAARLARTLWHEGYRQGDHDDRQPLQA